MQGASNQVSNEAEQQVIMCILSSTKGKNKVYNVDVMNYINNFCSRFWNHFHVAIPDQYLQDSRATDGTLIYADIGPNTIKQIQQFKVTDKSSYRVQYAEINYNAKAPQSLCEHPPKGVEEELRSGNLTSCFQNAYMIQYVNVVSCFKSYMQTSLLCYDT